MEAFHINYPLPLVTQQFRLRDLVKIVAHKVDRPSDEAKDVQYYYTLHKSGSTASTPLFTSSKASGSLEPLAWPDLKKDFGADSPLKAIIVKLYRAAVSPDGESQLIANYGINFSGLVPFSEHLVPRLKANSLVFESRSGYSFIGPDSIDNSTKEQQEDVMTEGENLEESSQQEHYKLRYNSIESTQAICGCSLEQLLRLQQSQLRLKYKREQLQSLIIEIRSTSGICNEGDEDDKQPVVSYYRRSQFSSSTNSSHHHAVGSMGKTLTKLLNMEPERVDPKTLAAALKLRRSIEAARVRCRLLTEERDRAKQFVENLKKRLASNCDRNVETDSLIMANYHGLSKEKEQYLHLKLTLTKNLETLSTVRGDMALIKQSLLKDLDEIYKIVEHSNGQFTINSILLPDAEAFETTHVPVTSVNVALGYVAHMVQITSEVLGVPLRNKIIFNGSHSEIMAQLHILGINLFPLYSRTMPPPQETKYAIFLLNQNITQLQFEFGPRLRGLKTDMRATLGNLMALTRQCVIMEPDLSQRQPYIYGAASCSSSEQLEQMSKMAISSPTDLATNRKISWTEEVSQR